MDSVAITVDNIWNSLCNPHQDVQKLELGQYEDGKGCVWQITPQVLNGLYSRRAQIASGMYVPQK